MPRFSKKEFIALAFINHQILGTAIRRGKIIPNNNNEIDTSLQINQDFLEKYVAKHKGKAVEEKIKEVEKKTIPTPKAPIPKADDVKPRNLSPADEEIEKVAIAKYNLDRIKKELEIDIQEQTIKINKIKLDKLNGVVIPTELVMVIFAQHSKSTTTAFHQAAENFVVEMASSYGVNKTDTAKMRGVLKDIINKGIKSSLEESKKQIDNIVDDYAVNGRK